MSAAGDSVAPVTLGVCVLAVGVCADQKKGVAASVQTAAASARVRRFFISLLLRVPWRSTCLATNAPTSSACTARTVTLGRARLLLHVHVGRRSDPNAGERVRRRR